MSEDNTYNILLSKLLAGTITSQEKWQLEKASLDDPFLADAIEGYYDNEGTSADIEALKQKILPPKKETKKRTLLFKRLSVAASLLTLLAASFWMFQNADPNELTAEKSTRVLQPSFESENTAKEISKPVNQVREEDQVVEKANMNDKLDTRPPAKPKASKALPQSAPMAASKAQRQEIVESDDLEAVVHQKENAPKVMDEVVITEFDEELLSDLNRSGNMMKVEKVNKSNSKAKKSPTRQEASEMDDIVANEKKSKSNAKEGEFYYVDGVRVIKEAETTANFSQMSTPSLPPTIRTGIVKNAEGIPLKGVIILDSKSNPIAETNAMGQFNVPPGLGYIITSFTGYDSETVAVTEELAIELQPAAEVLTQRHLRLIDQMTDTEVQRHYTNKLNEVFSRNWPICNQSFSTPIVTNAGRPLQRNITHLSTIIKIDENGRLDDVTYFEKLDEECAASINDVFQAAQSGGVFESGRPIEFRYRINL